MKVLFSALDKSAAHAQDKGVEDPALQQRVTKAFAELSDEDKALLDREKINWPEMFAKAFTAGKLIRDVLQEVRRLR